MTNTLAFTIRTVNFNAYIGKRIHCLRRIGKSKRCECERVKAQTNRDKVWIE
jgi:hypothetical protein